MAFQTKDAGWDLSGYGGIGSDKSSKIITREAADLTLATGAFLSQDGASRSPEMAPGAMGRDVSHQVVFIDSTVPDYQSLLAGLAAGTRVYVLDPNQDGLQQMARILEHSRDVSAVSIISHGAEGEIKLGSTILTSSNLGQHQAALQAIGDALEPNGDLLIYGCDVGEDASGVSFVDAIAQATGVTVAASSHLVGDAAVGDGWDLDVRTGAIAAPAVLDPVALGAFAHPLLLNDPPPGLPILVNSFSSNSGFLISGNATTNERWRTAADERHHESGRDGSLFDGLPFERRDFCSIHVLCRRRKRSRRHLVLPRKC